MKRYVNSVCFEQARKIVAPGDRDRDVPDRIFNQQVPADDPCQQFAKARVRICICRAGDGNFRCEFRITQSGKPASYGREYEQEDHARSAVVAGLSDHRKNARTDYRGNTKHRKVECAQRSP